MSAPEPVAVVAGLRVELTGSGADVVDDLNLELRAGHVVGLVGESGSGKTTAGAALLGYARPGATVAAGAIRIAGHDLRSLSSAQLRRLRGVTIGYVPQDPSSALNPSHRLETQLRELLDVHDIGTPTERTERIRSMLSEVGLPAGREFLRRYPHQLSGGQVQRVALAMALLPHPKVLVLDEPTTGLDVTTQETVLSMLRTLCRRFNVAALYVTHDLAAVARIADELAVMYGGRLVEYGPTDRVFRDPRHPYTRALLGAVPQLHVPLTLTAIPGTPPAAGARPAGCRFSDRCRLAEPECRAAEPAPGEVGDEHWARCRRSGELGPWDPSDRVVSDTNPAQTRTPVLSVEGLTIAHGSRQVVDSVSFDLADREVLALVGGSGAGKTTISRAVAGVNRRWSGEVRLHGEALATSARRRTAEQRQAIQYVFQNPYRSLNPRRTVEQILVRPLELFGIATGRRARERAAELLDDVQLGARVLSARADRLSGGERQRVAIARALAASPSVLVCDEITSALDVSIQASVTQLLTRIKNERGIALLFVTHNLALVRTIADRVLVLHEGRVAEAGLAAQVLDHPASAYARELVANTPTGTF